MFRIAFAVNVILNLSIESSNARVIFLTRTRSLETSCHFSSFDHITAARKTTILTQENNDETVKRYEKEDQV